MRSVLAGAHALTGVLAQVIVAAEHDGVARADIVAALMAAAYFMARERLGMTRGEFLEAASNAADVIVSRESETS